MKPLRKTLYYFLFYVSSTLFVYFCFSAAMSVRAATEPSSLTADILGKCVFLPFLYCSFSLVVALLSQSKFIKREDKTETMIYACFNIVFFLLILTLSIVLFVLGKRDSCLPITITAITLLSFSGIEIGYSVYMLLKLRKIEDPTMMISKDEAQKK